MSRVRRRRGPQRDAWQAERECLIATRPDDQERLRAEYLALMEAR